MNTVLIVEDEKMIRQGIRAIVQRSGVPVQNIMECNNGQLALEILQSQPVEIGCQQLKYLILNDNITPREVQTVAHQFEEQLLNQEYMVCCCERTADEAFLRMRHEVQYSAEQYHVAQSPPLQDNTVQRGEETIQGRPVEDRMRQIAQMIGTDRIAGALRMTEQFFSEVKWGRHSAEMFEKSIGLLIDEIRQIYRNVLREKEGELLRFRNIYQFSQIDELMEVWEKRIFKEDRKQWQDGK